MALTKSQSDEYKSLSQRGIDLALAPYRIATSRPAIKAYVTTFLFAFASTVLLSISSTAYALFYYNFVPQIGLESPIYLQYGPGSYTQATTQLESNALISQQAYDICIELRMPRTPSNLAAGNFMLDLSLLSQALPVGGGTIDIVLPNVTTTVSQSRRPAILSYRSPLLALADTAVALPWHTFGFRDLDEEVLTIPMFERVIFARGRKNVPAAAGLILQSESILQVYSAKIIFEARFSGFRYIIYNYRVLSFLVFTACFYTLAIASTAFAWLVVSSILSSQDQSKTPQEETSKAKIKEESHEDSELPSTNGNASNTIRKEPRDGSVSSEEESGLSMSNLSDSATTYPTTGRQMPLRFPIPGRKDSQSNKGAPIKVEEDADAVLGGSNIQPLRTEGADDEDEEPRGRERDSGIGTSLESGLEAAGIRRRSSQKEMRYLR